MCRNRLGVSCITLPVWASALQSSMVAPLKWWHNGKHGTVRTVALLEPWHVWNHCGDKKKLNEKMETVSYGWWFRNRRRWVPPAWYPHGILLCYAHTFILLCVGGCIRWVLCSTFYRVPLTDSILLEEGLKCRFWCAEAPLPEGSSTRCVMLLHHR